MNSEILLLDGIGIVAASRFIAKKKYIELLEQI